jgi:hypothetical protein
MQGTAATRWVTAWTVGCFGALLGLAGAVPADAASLQRDRATIGRPAPTDLSAQSRRRRGPTRLRVYPNVSYPGPNAVRQCVAHYEQEYRLSGTVIVPRMHCWWQRG